MIEEILDKSIQRLVSGENISTILSDCPEKYRASVEVPLKAVYLMRKLPKSVVPIGRKRRLYLNVVPAHASKGSEFFGTLKLLGFAFTAAFVIVIGGLYTAYAALSAVPGDKLFSLKKVIQTAQISFARTPESKAELQLNIASESLADAQKTLSQNNTSSSIQKQAAQEVTNQTTAALNNFKKVAASPSISQNPQILSKVQNLATASDQLLAQIDPQNAKQQTQQNQQTIDDIKKIIAATNEQYAANLANPATVKATGTVDAITKDQITIDKNTFVINITTTFFDQNGDPANISKIEAGDKVQITSSLQGSANIANSISIVEKAKPKPTPKTDVKPKPQPQDTTSPANSAPDNQAMPANPQDTFTGFISETPSNTNTNAAPVTNSIPTRP